MKTLEEVMDEIAREVYPEVDSWYDMTTDWQANNVNEVAKRYAQEALKEAVKCDNNKYEYVYRTLDNGRISKTRKLVMTKNGAILNIELK